MANGQKLHYNRLFKILGIQNKEDIGRISKVLGVQPQLLTYHNDNRIFPNGDLLFRVLNYLRMSEIELKLRMGVLDTKIIKWIADNPEILLDAIPEFNDEKISNFTVSYETDLGSLYQADCIKFMKTMDEGSIDMIFADPPFNLGKVYESGVDDELSEERYLEWTEAWLLECVRILAPGGSLFVYNIPYWQNHIANVLNRYLNFRHWIAIYMKGLVPVGGKLNPSHYGLLYYTKGERPKTFNKQRIPMATCRHCGGEIFDYGGKKKNLHENGLSIADVWTDIHPVRHKKFKNRELNELSVKLLHRIISLATNKGDILFDPFGGSGTTYAVAECLQRRWIGCEIGSIEPIINRLQNKDDSSMIEKIENETNVLFTEEQRLRRKQNKFWLLEDLR
ncbi:DNA-methyltransferase [Pelosinus sp. sgz500959]|uniref:DNA-methyltransferase n=1 Tax=Pelosinus sp. sgz500959 TaxID=3242472 RepID=UPI0036700CC6